jgi:hypothetical protein
MQNGNTFLLNIIKTYLEIIKSIIILTISSICVRTKERQLYVRKDKKTSLLRLLILEKICFRAAIWKRVAHRIATHQILTHRISTHRIATHQILTHRILTHRISTHQITSHQISTH